MLHLPPLRLALLSCLLSAAAIPLHAQGNNRFEVRFPTSLEAKPVTGRVFIALYPRDDAEPRLAAYQSARTRVGRIPFFAVDVEQLAPGAWAFQAASRELLQVRRAPVPLFAPAW